MDEMEARDREAQNKTTSTVTDKEDHEEFIGQLAIRIDVGSGQARLRGASRSAPPASAQAHTFSCEATVHIFPPPMRPMNLRVYASTAQTPHAPSFPLSRCASPNHPTTGTLAPPRLSPCTGTRRRSGAAARCACTRSSTETCRRRPKPRPAPKRTLGLTSPGKLWAPSTLGSRSLRSSRTCGCATCACARGTWAPSSPGRGQRSSTC